MRSVVLYGLLLVALACSANADRPLKPQDILEIRWATHVTMSPDGSHVAYLVHEAADASNGESKRPRSLWVAAADGRLIPRQVARGFNDVSEPHWSPDGAALTFLSSGDRPKRQVWCWKRETQQTHQITKIAHGVVSYRWSPKGDELAYLSNPTQESGGDPVVVKPANGANKLFVVSSESGESRELKVPVEHIVDFVWAPDAKRFAVLTAASSDPDEIFERQSLKVFDRQSEQAELLHGNCSDFPGLGWSPDGYKIAFIEYAPKHFAWRLAVIDVVTKEVSYPLNEVSMTPMMDFQWASDSRHLWVRGVAETRFQLFKVAIDGSLCELAAKGIHNCYSFDVSRDETRFAFTCNTPNDPSQVVVTSREHQQDKLLTELNPQIGVISRVTNKQVAWKNSKDGKKVFGVLLTPPGFQPGKPGKTVVLLHGGPQGVWWNSWQGQAHSWGQMLATHGYVVFLPNPRGSQGQGWRFAEGVSRDWGGQDVQDVLDGIDQLVEQNIIDRDRIGVGGWSYGGFLTASITTQSTQFKAAIVGAGITDLPTYALTVDEVAWVRSF
ncbi:MAG: alpha/beta fold hydrolase, partial [Planctomycetota bacterium]